MKITNETKVGALSAIAITFLILGFNFLKGKSIFKSGSFLYAKYADTKGLMISNPVMINGLQIGSVYELEEQDKNIDTIIVSIKLNRELNIPVNSIASISNNPLTSSSIVIELGNSDKHFAHDDTIPTSNTPGMLGSITQRITPLVDNVSVTVKSLDSVLRNINTIFDPYTKNNMQEVVANANKTMSYLVTSAASLNAILNSQTGVLSKSLNNVNSFTQTLARNNDKVDHMMANIETATTNFSKADIDGTINKMRGTVERLNAAVEKMDSKDGSLGLLLNDKQLYNNLENTTRSLNILMDDIRINPKRYVSISIFGGKSKGQPLTSPLPVVDTSGARL
jgi:phospholipid/cholesterol/gamma-HCH transport system substrate-binding protein